MLPPLPRRAQEPLSALRAPLELTPALAIPASVWARLEPGKTGMIASFCLGMIPGLSGVVICGMAVKEKTVQDISFECVILFSRGNECAEVWTGWKHEKMCEFLHS